MKKIYVLGGGTVFHVRPHFALSAPAYGKAARTLTSLLSDVVGTEYAVHLGLTKMAMGSMDRRQYKFTHLIGETNQEVAEFLEKIVTDPDTAMIFMSVALCDFDGFVLDDEGKLTASGKNQPRLKTKEKAPNLFLRPSDKLIGQIRNKRKDIFLVGFKTTAGAKEEEQYEAALGLLKKNSCNLVLANDVQTGLNMIVCPELATYSVSHDREMVLKNLVDMALMRAKNTFVRTEIVGGPEDLVPWKMAPVALQEVVNHCVKEGAYKPFNNVTVGHFGYKAADKILYSSRRRQNFNLPEARDLVKVDFSGERQVAYGAKPSAGARSQYEVLSRFTDLNCIVHFHCPLKAHSLVPVRPQKDFECGSIQCGMNTAGGMVRVNKDLAVVMLDKHGPNIVFSDKADPQMVIDFINSNFTLSSQTR